MQKNVLKESIELMGIADGDVVKLPNEAGVDCYQFKDGKLKYLGSCEKEVENQEMYDDEYIDLIKGTMDFEVITKKETVEEPTDEEYIDDSDCDDIEEDLNYIQCQVDYLLEKEEARTKNEEEKKKIAKWVDLGIIAFWGLALLLLLISNIF